MDFSWRVFYYEKPDGTYPVMEFIDALTPREQAKTLSFINLLEEHGPNLKRPYADLLEDGIHELRITLSGTQTRFLYFFCFRDIIILTNVFEKNTQAVPESEIKLAKGRRNDFYKRFLEEDFKEK
jgi:phage-related protein